jgi:hypothetical protein
MEARAVQARWRGPHRRRALTGTVPNSGGELRRCVAAVRGARRHRLRRCAPCADAAMVAGVCRARVPPHRRAGSQCTAPCHICTRTGLARAKSAPGSGPPLSHLNRDWARPCHICTGTGLTLRQLQQVWAHAPESALGLAGTGHSSLPHLHRDWARPCTGTGHWAHASHICTGTAHPLASARSEPLHLACCMLPASACVVHIVCCMLPASSCTLRVACCRRHVAS